MPERKHVVWPCELKVQKIISNNNVKPVSLEVIIVNGSLRVGTPISALQKDNKGMTSVVDFGSLKM